MNTIVAWCDETREAIWFDPGAEAFDVLSWLESNRIKVTRIVNTHGHVDHIAENGIAKKALGVPLCIHPLDRPKLLDPALNLSVFTGEAVTSPDADELLNEGDTLSFGKLSFKLYHVPGHSPGSLVFFHEGTLIAGDTLFQGSVGRTDFPDSDEQQLYTAIREKIYALPDETVVYPGHGDPTTVGYEKQYNPFVRA
ncbi:MAG: MBL fold metallo-hydrolase [Calditrichaeota bacterium]|nr:MBL fold metallo-hydrolase [Calditrichota bacterium]MCB9368038.1 MBL fold metallo-hydrolase [Calditrichota bacterium]